MNKIPSLSSTQEQTPSWMTNIRQRISTWLLMLLTMLEELDERERS